MMSEYTISDAPAIQHSCPVIDLVLLTRWFVFSKRLHGWLSAFIHITNKAYRWHAHRQKSISEVFNSASCKAHA
jgi:hypothetical protein